MKFTDEEIAALRELAAERIAQKRAAAEQAEHDLVEREKREAKARAELERELARFELSERLVGRIWSAEALAKREAAEREKLERDLAFERRREEIFGPNCRDFKLTEGRTAFNV